MASRLISNNTNRTLGDLLSFDRNSNGTVKIIQYRDLSSEINGISNLVKRQLDANQIDPEDVLILVPVSKIGYRIRNALVSRGVNSKSYFRESALGTNQAKRIFSIINLAARPNDLVALRYLLGYGSQNYRTKSYNRILEYSNTNDQDVLTVLNRLKDNEISIPYTKPLVNIYTEIINEIDNFVNYIQEDRKNILNIIDPEDEANSDFRNIISFVIDEIGFLEDEPIQSFFEKLYSLIVENVYFSQNITEQDHVRIMSLHSSKGLSAKFVIIMSCIDELLPRVDLDATAEEKRMQLEEQRRLFYVALTRCKCSPDYPGTLVISSFVGLPGNEALQINIPAKSSSWRSVRASRFISEFEETAPQTISVR